MPPGTVESCSISRDQVGLGGTVEVTYTIRNTLDQPLTVKHGPYIAPPLFPADDPPGGLVEDTIPAAGTKTFTRPVTPRTDRPENLPQEWDVGVFHLYPGQTADVVHVHSCGDVVVRRSVSRVSEETLVAAALLAAVAYFAIA